MTVLKWIVIFAALGYVGVLAALYFAQRSIIFPIPTTMRTTPAAAGFPQAEEHVLMTSDGEKVIVWHVAPKGDHRVVVYFPGNGDTLAGNAGRFAEITAGGAGLVALSYRGYAGSSGAPSEDGLLRDAEATFSFASTLYEPKRMVVWVYSLGTGAAVALAAEYDVGALILEAPYTRSRRSPPRLTRFSRCAVSSRIRFTAISGSRASPRRCSSCTERWIQRCRSALVSGCSRSPMSQSNSCALTRAGMTISAAWVRSKRLDNS
jgi:pimeloyl-ACP methyl ester carboxylesterase